jgi:Anti-sigma-K factor rskA/Sigma-70, region 4
MTDLDRLPPDQRAVLSLVLDRGKSYGEVGEMLAIPESAVRDRAHAALDALAGASDAGAASAPGPPPDPDDRSRPPAPTGSRRAGALLLGAIVVVIVVAVVLISSGGGKSAGQPTTASTGAASTSTASTSTSAGKPPITKTIALTPIDPTVKANGSAYVLSQKGRYAFYVAARSLPPSSGFFYAVWLYNSPSSAAPLGRAPTVGSDGRMEGGGPLPTNASLYHQLIITHETSTHPGHPGPIVLRGTFGLH